MSAAPPPVATLVQARRQVPRRRLLLLAPAAWLLGSCARGAGALPAEPTPLAAGPALTTVSVHGLDLRVPDTWTLATGVSAGPRQRAADVAEPTEAEAADTAEATEAEAAPETGPEPAPQGTEQASDPVAGPRWRSRLVDGTGQTVVLVSTPFTAGDLDQASALSRALVLEALPGATALTSVDLGAVPGTGPVRLVLNQPGQEPDATAWTVPVPTGHVLVLLLVDDDHGRNALEDSLRQDGGS